MVRLEQASKFLVLAGASGALWWPAASRRAVAATPDMAPRAVINRYCLGCHNDRLRTAGITLSAAAAGTPGQNPALWEKVVRKLSHRLMPPAGLPRPEESTYTAVVSRLVEELDRAAETRPYPGRTPTFRRLTRTEYRNAIRDLLALDVDVSALLPSDESSYGFDNITVGDLSATLLEKYLTAAQRISRMALGAVRAPASETVLVPPELTQEYHREGLPFGTRGGARVTYHFPADGAYEIHLRLTRDRDERVEGLTDVHYLDLLLDGVQVGRFKLAPLRGGDHQHVDKDFKVRIPVSAGSHEVAAAFVKKTSALVETERQPYVARFNADRHPRAQPALYSIYIAGPYDASGAGDTPSRRRIFVCYPRASSEEEPCAEKILSTLVRRAWRRPVTGADLEAPLRLFRETRAAEGFEKGIEIALRAVLVSPQFLFRIERDPAEVRPEEAYRISDLELASRLSFFLWSSIPDDELLDLAAAGKLSDPAVLEQQTRRMLADPRSHALVNNFAAQWLQLRNLESAHPDPRLFPDFDHNLRESMRRETELLVETVLRQDRSVLELLRARYTFLDERLARHYGVSYVYGSRFRKVELGPELPRGGLLGHASILTVTSYANRTSPVLRGKWILANLLGTPPSPPPPELPPLKATDRNGRVLTGRERLAQHRASPACASCHNVMDPLGFALENYDAVGRWRSLDEGKPVDATGALADGTAFRGPGELREALLRRPELVVSTVTEKLLIYALGRGLEYYDAPAVRRVVREAARDDFRISSVIVGIVRSTPFQMRSSP